MQILEIIQNYIKLFIDEKNALSGSKNTIRSYQAVLDKFYDFVTDEVSLHKKLKITDINRYFLNNYILSMDKNNLSRRTQHHHIIVIVQFLTFLADSDIKTFGAIKQNITGVKVKFEQKEIEAFNQDEQQKIIGVVKSLDKSKNFTAHRTSLILKILLFHGVRISELINLTWSNIQEEYDEADGYVYKFTYMGKGSKERSLDFPIAFVRDNMDIIKKHKNSNYVIPSSTGGKMAQGNIYITIKKLLAKQGINKFGLHIFRHTFGDNNAAMNINLAVMSKLMGHSSTAITSKYYVRVSNKTKRDAIFKRINKFIE